MEKFEVPNYDGPGNYLTRWRVIRTPWAAIYVHRFDGPDPRPTLHDHPWNFTSIVLRGGYVERRLNAETLEVDEAHTVRRVNRVRAAEAHSIMRLLRVPTWTLMLVGRRTRTWGYLQKAAGPMWAWTPFDKHPHALEFNAAMARRRSA